MTPEVIELLEGVVTLYIADFKFGNDGCASRLAGVDRYVKVVERNLLLVSGHTPLLIRHLLMPGHFDCCFVPVARWLSHHLVEVPFTLMTGYVPAWRAGADDGLGRTLTADELDRAEALLRDLGLRRAC
jgi:putative pyruvate formate lyase activating enzyme